MKTKILLIAPATGKWRAIGRNRLFNGRTFRFSLQSLLTVAAATPEWADVQVVDEQVEEVPRDGPFDLVGITCMTAAAPRAYEIAKAFRARGIPVVLGGMHPTLCAEEAVRHADAVVIGEAEDVWPRVVVDAREGRLQPVYRSTAPCDLGRLKPVPLGLLKKGAYAPVYAVQASRGCSNHCSFCSVAAFHAGTQRYRPVSRVVEELRQAPQRRVVFIDDNLMADRAYARRLFLELIPLGKQWVTQCTLDFTADGDLVELAARAGCVGVFVGLETFGNRNLESLNKGFNRLERYGEAVRLLHRHGIGVEAGIVLGLPNDGPEVARETLQTLERLEVDAVQVSCCTPLPGTPLFHQLEDRIVDHDWTHYDFHHAVFEPARMTVTELQQAHDWLTSEFYRPWRIARRLARHLPRFRTWGVALFSLALNLAYLGRVLRWGIGRSKSVGAITTGGTEFPALSSGSTVLRRPSLT